MTKDRILVVDDDPDNRAMISHFLTNWGYDVDDAKNGQVALEKVSAQAPNLVLLDLEMPVMNGFETCERLKTNPETEWIPVVIFTGLEKMPNRIRGFRHGADDYVVKTCDPDELRTRIEMVLKRTRHYSNIATEPAEPSTAVDDQLTISVSLARIPFPEAMRLVLAAGKNGVVTVTNGQHSGTVHIYEGNVIHATRDTDEGLDAFYELALWKTGRFDFQDADPGTIRSIQESSRSLLVEAGRRLDSWNTIQSKVPSFDLVPQCVPLAEASSIRLTKSDWALIRLVDGRRSIREIVDMLRADMFLAGRIVFNLITIGILRLGSGAGQQEQAFDLVPERGDQPISGEPYQLHAAEWELLTYVNGRRSLGLIHDSMGLTTPEFMKVARSLKDRGFIRFVGERKKKAKPQTA